MNKYMKKALDEAYKGIRSGDGGPFGSVIVKGGEVIASGHNEVLKQGDPTCHGEMVTIRAASRILGTHDLSGCEIYTTGEPCPMCLGAIMWANIDKVYYGCNITDTDLIGFRDEAFYERARDPHANGFIEELDREVCLELYKEYSEIKDKKIY